MDREVQIFCTQGGNSLKERLSSSGISDGFVPQDDRPHAVYGAPRKILTGDMPLKNLFLCGTDQGFLGIIGSMLSGITFSNNQLLRD